MKCAAALWGTPALLLVAGCLPLSALAEGEETPAPAVEEQAE